MNTHTTLLQHKNAKTHTLRQIYTLENVISVEKETMGHTNANVEVLNLTSWTYLLIQFCHIRARESL